MDQVLSSIDEQFSPPPPPPPTLASTSAPAPWGSSRSLTAAPAAHPSSRNGVCARARVDVQAEETRLNEEDGDERRNGERCSNGIIAWSQTTRDEEDGGENGTIRGGESYDITDSSISDKNDHGSGEEMEGSEEEERQRLCDNCGSFVRLSVSQCGNCGSTMELCPVDENEKDDTTENRTLLAR